MPRSRRSTSLTLWHSLLAVGLLLALGSTAAEAKKSHTERSIEAWTEEIRRIDRHLRDEEWATAHKLSNRLLSEMCDSIVTGGESFLGTVATLRAIALAGEDEIRDAAWDRHVALQLFPETAEIDLAPYGRAGEILVGISDSEGKYETIGMPIADRDLQTGQVYPDVTPPRKRKTPNPKFPKGQRGGGQTVKIVVEVILDKQGIPTYPRLVRRSGEVPFLFATMDALKKWRFKPAERGGEPVSVIYNLTVNYKL